jgi:hypothetical protein
MNDFVSKPVKKEVLAATLNKWLISTHPLRRKTIDGGKQSFDKLKSLTVLYVEDEACHRANVIRHTGSAGAFSR